MATLPATRLLMSDMLKYLDPDGMATPVVELLAQKGAKEIMGYLPWQPGNLALGHQFSVRTGEPTAELRDFQEGIAPSKSSLAQQTEGMCNIEAWAEVDEAEANLNGQGAAFRAGENKAFISALEKKFMAQFIAGNSRTSRKEINGIQTRLSSLAAGNVLDCGGTGSADNTSIYLLNFGDEFFGTYPKGTPMGIRHNDLGKQVIQMADNKRMVALMTQFVMTFGIVVRNWRRINRAANINVADLRARATTQATTASTNILYALSDMLQMLPDGDGTRVFGCNRTVIASLAKMGLDRSQNVLSVERGLTQFGRPFEQVSFLGVPFVPMDAITNTEAHVV